MNRTDAYYTNQMGYREKCDSLERLRERRTVYQILMMGGVVLSAFSTIDCLNDQGLSGLSLLWWVPITYLFYDSQKGCGKKIAEQEWELSRLEKQLVIGDGK